jgi:hypothetical protein
MKIWMQAVLVVITVVLVLLVVGFTVCLQWSPSFVGLTNATYVATPAKCAIESWKWITVYP